MMRSVLALTLILAVTADPLGIRRLTGRIVGGQSTTIENHPHQVSLQLFNEHKCGGSIISSHWIVTAGHCLDSPLWAKVRAGSTFKNSGGSLHQVVEVFQHPGYAFSKKGVVMNDIALVRVMEPFEFDETRQPIPMFDVREVSTSGVMSTVTGWGHTLYGYPDDLLYVEVPIVSKSECNERYRQIFDGIADDQICAGFPEGGKDACGGDSGGPLVIGGRLAGVVSWGLGCADARYPGVYTEVAAHRSWIRKISGV